jgi:hypothetical protein
MASLWHPYGYPMATLWVERLKKLEKRKKVFSGFFLVSQILFIVSLQQYLLKNINNMAKINQVGIGRNYSGTIDGITYITRNGVTWARSTPHMPQRIYKTPAALKRQALFRMIQMHIKYHLNTIRCSFSPQGNASPSNRYYSVNNNALKSALDALANQYAESGEVTLNDVENAICTYSVGHPDSICIASKDGYNQVFLNGSWPDAIVMKSIKTKETLTIKVS